MSHHALLEMAGLRLEFRRTADRFAHQVWAIADGRSELLLASQEAAADDVWPSSPPLQELHLESRPGGRELALLVGMAGHSHWSLSAELDPAAGSLAFDVACRMRDGAGPLGSLYQTERIWRWSPEPTTLTCTALGRNYRIEVDRVVAPDGRLALPSSTFVLVEPAHAKDASAAPRTVRWRFVVSTSSE